MADTPRINDAGPGLTRDELPGLLGVPIPRPHREAVEGLLVAYDSLDDEDRADFNREWAIRNPTFTSAESRVAALIEAFGLPSDEALQRARVAVGSAQRAGVPEDLVVPAAHRRAQHSLGLPVDRPRRQVSDDA